VVDVCVSRVGTMPDLECTSLYLAGALRSVGIGEFRRFRGAQWTLSRGGGALNRDSTFWARIGFE
jgi:hypothetical protein